MGETTGISWTDKTWNPWYGCHKVSEGCRFCYMYREMKQYGKQPAVVQRSKTTFAAPLKWKEPALVFTCSWSDWFIEEADAWRDEAWDIIRRTPHLTYQILTKRPERIPLCLPPDWPFPNVWLGISAENQRYADERIPLLLQAPAAVRFVSAEPLLEPVSLDRWFGLEPGRQWSECLCSEIDPDDRPCIVCEGRRELGRFSGLHWVIAGGESGPEARPMHPAWVRSLRDQCQTAAVPFHFKQWGEWVTEDQAPEDAVLPGRSITPKGWDMHGPAVYRIGKKAASALLDGREWREMPLLAPAVPTCRVCGCTDEDGCADGCWWVEPDLCSSCARESPLHTEATTQV